MFSKKNVFMLDVLVPQRSLSNVDNNVSIAVLVYLNQLRTKWNRVRTPRRNLSALHLTARKSLPNQTKWTIRVVAHLKV